MLAGLLLLCGCFPGRSTVVLLPDAEGKVGEIRVTSGRKTVIVDEPYRSVRSVPLFGAQSPERIEKSSIERTFQAALEEEPPQRFRFSKYVFYFFLNSAELFPSSEKLLSESIQLLLEEPPAEIYVVGHADRTGTELYNRQLSHARSMAIRQELIDGGVVGEIITISYLGETMPAVETPDEVPEPRNRRAELILKYPRSRSGS